MPPVREHHPIGVVCSDLHISSLQPSCRADKDWWEVQAHYLHQLETLAGELPVFIAGDIFDRWNPNPETINFAIDHLPDEVICIPGQHDLPNHRLEEMHRSGYGTLVAGERVTDISNIPFEKERYTVHGVAWGQDIPIVENSGYVQILLCHRYIWTEGFAYPGAPEGANIEANRQKYKKTFKGFAAAIFGDNHKGFLSTVGATTIFNCGGFIRRKSDEIGYRPQVGILMNDGSVERKFLDTEIDQFHETVESRKDVPINMRDFIDQLESLGEHGLNFREAVENHLREDDEIEEHVKQMILKSLDA